MDQEPIIPHYHDCFIIGLTPPFDKDSNFSLLHKIDTKSISVGGDGINTLINNSKDDNKGKKRKSMAKMSGRVRNVEGGSNK